VLTKDGICTLDDVITNLEQMDLISQSCAIQRFITFYVIRVKENNYCD
jgi:hypothetical protein